MIVHDVVSATRVVDLVRYKDWRLSLASENVLAIPYQFGITGESSIKLGMAVCRISRRKKPTEKTIDSFQPNARQPNC